MNQIFTSLLDRKLCKMNDFHILKFIHNQTARLYLFSLIYEDIFNLEKLSKNAEQFKMLHGAAIIIN